MIGVEEITRRAEGLEADRYLVQLFVDAHGRLPDGDDSAGLEEIG